MGAGSRAEYLLPHELCLGDPGLFCLLLQFLTFLLGHAKGVLYGFLFYFDQSFLWGF